jgi:hypothetical protein
MGTSNRDPVVRRIAVLLSVFIFGCLGVVALAQPAFASQCATNAHVYVINPSGYAGTFVKQETDPIDGGTYDFSVRADTTISFQLGGNGLTPYSTPFWQVFDQSGQNVRTLTGSTTSGNCVSNQKTFTTSASLGTVHTYKVTYQTGNSQGAIQGQAHFRFIFDQPADNGGGDDGGGGDGGGGCLLPLPCLL